MMVTSLLQNLGFRFGQSDTNKKCSKGVISLRTRNVQPNIMGCGLKPISHVWLTKIVKYDEDKGDYQPHDFV